MNIPWKKIDTENGSTVSAVIGGDVKIADDSHPNFSRILAGLERRDPNVGDLFDLNTVLNAKFERVSERVTVANGQVYFDGDPLHSDIAGAVARFHESEEDFRPLVNFFEKLMQNPVPHSREQLYTWLRDRHFSITRDGDILAYKGVKLDPTSGSLVSYHAGPAIVDNVPHDARQPVPNNVGSTIELARSEVAWDPATACSSGLHAGTFGYANMFGATTLLVRVNPRDVVSVPTDSGGQKVRVCRYTVVDYVQEELTTFVLSLESEEDGEWIPLEDLDVPEELDDDFYGDDFEDDDDFDEDDEDIFGAQLGDDDDDDDDDEDFDDDEEPFISPLFDDAYSPTSTVTTITRYRPEETPPRPRRWWDTFLGR